MCKVEIFTIMPSIDGIKPVISFLFSRSIKLALCEHILSQLASKISLLFDQPRACHLKRHHLIHLPKLHSQNHPQITPGSIKIFPP